MSDKFFIEGIASIPKEDIDGDIFAPFSYTPHAGKNFMFQIEHKEIDGFLGIAKIPKTFDPKKGLPFSVTVDLADLNEINKRHFLNYWKIWKANKKLVQLSIGYRAMRVRLDLMTHRREILSFELMEISLLWKAANKRTKITRWKRAR